ncbi:hypothetical protein [Streptomyces sp. GC420]|uniref:hypothetical protein n=1 Tax=Streptomyces sp. GC420 TaxID=2697568 RepID=UPI001414D48E|nr:hypothetical protein [Streptomyces sp. GC420]NBM18263.1 hypothetical protein [Streptomyces sp. GC420]
MSRTASDPARARSRSRTEPAGPARTPTARIVAHPVAGTAATGPSDTALPSALMRSPVSGTPLKAAGITGTSTATTAAGAPAPAGAGAAGAGADPSARDAVRHHGREARSAARRRRAHGGTAAAGARAGTTAGARAETTGQTGRETTRPASGHRPPAARAAGVRG